MNFKHLTACSTSAPGISSFSALDCSVCICVINGFNGRLTVIEINVLTGEIDGATASATIINGNRDDYRCLINDNHDDYRCLRVINGFNGRLTFIKIKVLAGEINGATASATILNSNRDDYRCLINDNHDDYRCLKAIKCFNGRLTVIEVNVLTGEINGATA